MSGEMLDTWRKKEGEQCGCFVCVFKSHNCMYVREFNLLTVTKGVLSQLMYVNEIPG